MNKLKLNTWKNIEKEFNFQLGETYRDSLCLRKKYENLKKKTKKKASREKCHALETGGGPLKKGLELTDVDVELREILGCRIDGLTTEYGGDSVIVFEETKAYEILNKVLNDEQSIELPSPPNEELPSPQNEPLPPTSKADETIITAAKRNRNEYEALCANVTQWAGIKSTLEKEKIILLKKEHDEKLNLMKEKNLAEIENLKKETQAKIKKIESEMEATIEGILEQNKIKKEILLLEKAQLVSKFKK
ncbi:unnamed protein product [Brassicogethes aeneus]|uniref:Regulatory protein zeste n=1 Tax=Brassicogethes aeneus TaxID=1431903 RepID=A0A9P0FKI1_BRAAE|nr:unnamed protein product [Brassicogethes aeneus]